MTYEQEKTMNMQADRQYVGDKRVILDEMAIPEGMLFRLIAQLRESTMRVGDIANMLHAHADRLHGAAPGEAVSNAATPVRSGALGELEDALDQLERSCSNLNNAANRNCNLA